MTSSEQLANSQAGVRQRTDEGFLRMATRGFAPQGEKAVSDQPCQCVFVSGITEML